MTGQSSTVVAELALAALAATDETTLAADVERILGAALGRPISVTTITGVPAVAHTGGSDELIEEANRVLALAARRLARERELEDYRAHVESIPIVTYVDRADEWSSNLFISPNVEELLGYSTEEWQTRRELSTAVIHSADVGRVLEAVAEVAATGKTFAADYRMVSRSGRIVWVRDCATPFDLPDGTKAVRGYLLDITDSVVADRTPLITYVDFPGDSPTTAYFSDNIEAVLGVAADDLVGPRDLFLDLVHPDDRESAEQNALRALEGEAALVEYRVGTADGRWVWLRDRALPQFGPNGEVLSVWGSLADVTAVKELARSREEAEERYRDLLEEMPGIAYVDRPDAFPTTTYMSPRVEAILGYTAAEIVADPGLWLGTIVHPDDRARAAAEIASSNAGARLTTEFRCIARDGREVWFYGESIPQRDSGGAVIAVRGYLLDITARKQAEIERLAAEERYRQFLEEVPGIVYVDAADEIASSLYLSPQVEQILGYTPQELMESPSFFTDHVVHPDDRDRLLAQIASTNGGVRETIEYRCRTRDGSIVWIFDESVPQFDTSGKVVAVRGFMLDVTDRRLAEERRSAAERESRRLLEELPLITYVERTEGEDVPTEYISPQVEQILGYRPEELMGDSQRFYELVHPDDRAQTEVHTRRAAAGEVFESEYRIRAADGGYVWFLDRSTPQFDEHGNVERVRGFMLDISERKRTEAERRRAETQYQSLLEQVPGIVYVDAVDDTGSILYISPRIVEILGYPLEAWYGSSDFFTTTVLHPDDREAVLSDIARNNAGEQTSLDYRCVAADGRIVWFRDESAPQFDPDGNAIATLGFMVDITDRKLAEEELQRRDEFLRQAQRMEAVGRLAGGIAHDFNNLLTVISGRVDLLTNTPGVDAEVRADLDEIGAAANRAAALTRQLLAFSRRQLLQPSVVDLAEVVSGLSTMLRRLLAARITLAVKHDPEVWPVLVDRGQLEQVIVNLVVNARDALPSGGTITIETRNVHAALLVEDDGSEPVDGVALVVADTGVGVPPEARPHIFEPFFTTKPVGEGTGLGLSTVRGIVEQSGGTIDVQSEPGEGTVFTATFPRAQGAPTAAEPPPRPIDASDPASILVVEDDAGVRALVRSALERAGHVVAEAPDAATALTTTARDGAAFDLLLTDLVMPGLNGRELAEQLQERDVGLKVLFMSGYTNDEVIRHRVPTSAQLIHKPFRPDEIVEAVHRALGRAGD